MWVAFDTETTGVEPGSRLIELAATLFDDRGTVHSEYVSLVQPGMPLPPDLPTIHDISDGMLAGAPPARYVLESFLDWLPADVPLVGHNLPFDLNILGWEASRNGIRLPQFHGIDTLPLARWLGETPDNRLGTLAVRHGWSEPSRSHRAAADATIVRRFFLYARPRVRAIQKLNSRRWSISWAYPHNLPNALGWLPQAIAHGSACRVRIGSSPDLWMPWIPLGMAFTPVGLEVHGWLPHEQRRNFVHPGHILD